MAITSYKVVVGYYNSAGTPNITTAVTGQLSDGWIPIGSPILTDAYGQCTQMMAKTDATPVITTSAYTVVTAANPQPPDATWDAQGEPLWIDTATYLQAYTKGGAYLQSTVNLASGQVTGVLPVAKGGTGATTATGARTNLQINRLQQFTNDQTRVYSGDGNWYFEVGNDRPWGVYNPATGWRALDIAQGGTGATTAVAALANLGGVAGDAVRAYIRGFNFQCTANQVTVGPGEANINGVVRRSTGNLVINTGTLPANAWYHVYLYWGGSSVAAETVATPPTVSAYPAFTKQGDTSRRYIGSIRTNVAGALIPQISTDGLTIYLMDSSANARLVAGGTATTATVFSAANRAYSDNTLSLRLACSNGDTTASNSSLAVWSLGGTSRNGTLVSPGTRVVQDIPCTNPSVCYYQMTTTPSQAAAFIDLVGYSYAR